MSASATTRPATRRNGLPVYLTRLIGREREVQAALDQLAGARLITFTGPGGIGKTRLAVEIARAWTDAHPSDAWLVDVSTLPDESAILGAVAETVGLPDVGRGELSERVTAFLQQGEALLVFDNCERAVEAAAATAHALLAACPALKVLATSREPLGLAGEVLREVPPLDIETGALALFEERTRAIAPGIPFGAQAEVARRICERLDGMPLAIELAAARARVLSLVEIDERLSNRFALLSGGNRSLPERHRTLGAALDWSYQLLGEKEAALYARLSVFAGGWTLRAAEEICSGDGIDRDEVVDLLTGLVDRSLVVVDTSSDPARYRMLETIREHAALRLEDPDAWRQRHFDWMLAFAEQAAVEVRGRDQVEWIETLHREQANLRSALAWASEQQERSILGLRLAIALGENRFALPARDTTQYLEQFLSRVGQAHARLYAAGLLALGNARWCAGILPAVSEALEPALRIAESSGDEGLLARIQLRLGGLRALQGEHEPALSLLARCRPVFEAAGDTWSLACIVVYRSFVECVPPGSSEAEAELAIVRGTQDRWLLSTFLVSLGEEARTLGAFADARRYYEESLELRAQLSRDAAPSPSVSQLNLGMTALMEGNTAEGAARLLALLASIAIEPSPFLEGGLLMSAGVAAAIDGEATVGAQLLGAADAMEHSVGSNRNKADELVFAHGISLCRQALGDDAFDASYREGRSLGDAAALEMAKVTLQRILAREAAPEDRRSRRPGGLSAQELEVLRLLASGCTNREIAAELVISVRTVENHVFNAYNKIGARGRAEATAWAIAHGVADAGSVPA